MADISLSKAVRSNLLSLQNTASMMAKTQDRLATGNRVNSALDNPTNFFTAASLNSRAADLNNLMDSMSNSVKTIEEADNGLKSITKLVESAQSTLRQALGDAATKTKPQAFVESYASTTVANTESGLTGKSVRETALDKFAAGPAAGATGVGTTKALAGSAGIVGAADTSIFLTVGSTTHTITIDPTAATVRDVVNAVNASGLATASVDDAGKFTITSNDSKTLKVNTGTIGTQTVSGMRTLDATGANIALPLAGSVPAGVSSEVRTKLVEQFNQLRTQIGTLAKDSSFNGINLLAGDKLKVQFNEKSGAADGAKLDIQGTKLDADSLGILSGTSGGAAINFQSDADLETATQGLTKALVNLRTIASNLGSNLSIVQTRQDFTKSTINTLQTGAANLTLADMNEEAANMLALQTRQSLAQSTLGMASQADQGILQLLR